MRKKNTQKKKVLFYVITGMSGAGKSQAIKCLEDMGFFCVDNLPVTLLPKFGELCLKLGGKSKKVAIGVDVRLGRWLNELHNALSDIKRQGIESKIIFFDADNQTLLRRFSETRRRHPLGRRILGGIAQERVQLREIKSHADRICDTSELTINELRETLSSWVSAREYQEINIIVMSFGYKYGLPPDADVVMDVRFLPNPNYVRSLKHLTGKERKVKEYVNRQKATKNFLQLFSHLLSLIIPRYIAEGKLYLTIAVGCTGGRHRSVVVSGKIAGILASKGYPSRILHRDINR